MAKDDDDTVAGKPTSLKFNFSVASELQEEQGKKLAVAGPMMLFLSNSARRRASAISAVSMLSRGSIQRRAAQAASVAQGLA